MTAVHGINGWAAASLSLRAGEQGGRPSLAEPGQAVTTPATDGCACSHIRAPPWCAALQLCALARDSTSLSQQCSVRISPAQI